MQCIQMNQHTNSIQVKNLSEKVLYHFVTQYLFSFHKTNLTIGDVVYDFLNSAVVFDSQSGACQQCHYFTSSHSSSPLLPFPPCIQSKRANSPEDECELLTQFTALMYINAPSLRLVFATSHLLGYIHCLPYTFKKRTIRDKVEPTPPTACVVLTQT